MATTLSISTSAADADAVEAIEQHHAELFGALTRHVEVLVAAAAATSSDTTPVDAARAELVRWCERELVPHAEAEEAALYPPAHATEVGRELVVSMIAEHAVIRGLVTRIAETSQPVRAAGAAMALQVLFETHMTKENEQVLPLLARAQGVSLAGLLDEMHQTLVDPHEATSDDVLSSSTADAGHECGCGEEDAELPELDARLVPHAIRHATIFGALDAVAPGSGMVLVAPHDPLPLLAQLEQRDPGAFEVSYLQRGPDAWRLQMVRTK